MEHESEIMAGKDVILKTASGSEWTIDKDGSVLLKYGLKECFESHCLNTKDTVIFKYSGDRKFDVTMFDGETSIEKACSYFVMKII